MQAKAPSAAAMPQAQPQARVAGAGGGKLGRSGYFDDFLLLDDVCVFNCVCYACVCVHFYGLVF